MKDSETLSLGLLPRILGLRAKLGLSRSRGMERSSGRFFTITLPAFPVMLWVILFVFTPMGIMAVYSFWTYKDFDMLPIWTVKNYLSFFTEWMYLKVTLRTLLIAAVTTVLCVALGYPVSYYLARRAGRWRNFLIVMIMIPFWTSFLIRTYVWMTILGEQGIINYVLKALGIVSEPVTMLYTTGAVIMASIYLFIPFPILSIYSSLEKLGFSLQEAAMDLGATPWRAFRKVTFPLSLAGVQASIIFVFIPVMGLFVTPALVGGAKGTMIGMLQVNIFKNAANFPLGSAISFMILLIVLLFVGGLGRSVDLEKVYSGGIGQITKAMPPSRQGFSFLNVYVVLVYLFLYLPIIFLIIFSVNSNFAGSFPFTGFTLQWYHELRGDPWLINSVKNSLMIAVVSSFVAVSIAAPAAYTVARFNFPGKAILKQSLIIPMIVPAIMLGFALLSLFNAADMTLSIVTVIVGHVTFVLPYVFFVISAQQYGFDKSLEEAGMDLGANRGATFRRITLPLMVPGLIAGGLFAFTLSLDEFIITFLLTGVTQTLPLFVWGMLRTMVAPTVNAVGSLIVVASFIMILVSQFIFFRRKRL